MLHAVLHSEPLLRIHDYHRIDEIQGRIPHIVPVRRWIVKLASFDLLRERVGEFFTPELIGERGESAEADVEDYAAGPDVYRMVVAPCCVFCEDLGCDVWREGTS